MCPTLTCLASLLLPSDLLLQRRQRHRPMLDRLGNEQSVCHPLRSSQELTNQRSQPVCVCVCVYGEGRGWEWVSVCVGVHVSMCVCVLICV